MPLDYCKVVVGCVSVLVPGDDSVISGYVGGGLN